MTPALEQLNRFIKEKYLPACREETAASRLPGGAAFYEFAARVNTTTELTPKEIHETGRREGARIRKQMESVIEKVGFKGSFQDFLTFLRTDKRF